MDDALSNPDLAPTRPDQRTWNALNIASLWIGMSVCIPSYMLASSMIAAGLDWRLSLLAIFLGNAIVLAPLVASAHAGTRYGIPFPVFARAAFGTAGTHVPSLLRAAVACGWFGIQTWVGGMALDALLGILVPAWTGIGGEWRMMGYGAPQYLAFLLFWLLNLYFVWTGTEGIKHLETISAPLLVALCLALLAWAISVTGGVGRLMEGADTLSGPALSRGAAIAALVPWTTAMVGYWATLALNIPDFTRYARSQRDQVLGQAVGLLTTMPLVAFVGVAVTSATVARFGTPIWNPVDLLARLSAESGNPLLGIASMAAILVATLTTNIAANVVAPANSFANLWPSRVTFRTGGVIAAGLGVAIMPWKLLDVYQGWLLSYSGLLGSVGGVMFADYILLRRGRLVVEDLYNPHGVYSYDGGVNRAAVAALVAGVLVALGGLVYPGARVLFDASWFSAGGTSAAVYVLLMRRARVPSLTREAA